jgi:hypothetical protein
MRSIGDADLRFRVGHGVELSVSWLIKAASVLLMSHAKLFHHVFPERLYRIGQVAPSPPIGVIPIRKD